MTIYNKPRPFVSDLNKVNTFILMRELLSDGGLSEIKDFKHKSIFYVKEMLYASLELKDDLVVVTFKKPRDLRGLVDKLSYYNELESLPGWLEFVTYADESLQDQIQADLGCFIGQTIFELNSVQTV